MRVFNIDITRKGISPVVQVTEHDAMSRFFTLVLRNGSADYEPPEGATYSVWYKTKDSHGWYDTITEPDEGTHPAVVADGNAFTIEIAEQATTSCGELALMINGDDGYQLTVSGIITRSDDIPGYDGEEVENYYNVYIADMRKNAARAENAAQTAIEYGATIDVEDETLIIDHYDDAGEVETWATVSEAWAVGKRNGVDVPSTDETYHNNSKYYAGQAGTAASAAASSAASAETAAHELQSLLIHDTASGAVASFADGADNIPMKSIVAEITPVQSGSGDPSPTNIRPISGRTGLTVTRAGKNLFDTSTLFRVNGNTFRSGFVYLPSGTYTYSRPSADNLYDWYVRGVESEAYSPFTNLVTGGTNQSSGSFTLANGSLIYIEFYNGSGIADGAIKDIQIEAGSTATAYEPYVGQTYPITWESIAGTVYGGTLDVVSGVLTVTHGYILLDGTRDIQQNGRTKVTQRAIVSIADKAFGTTNIRSDRFAVTSAVDAVGKMSGRPSTIGVEFYLPLEGTENTTASCKQWFADNNTQLVYELATPQTYQLTPTEVRTILGGNTIYTDAGAVSVEYVADTKLYIDNKIAELQALVLEN